MDFETIAERFHTDGFVLLEDFFEEPLMVQLDEVIRSHYGDAPPQFHEDEFVSAAEVEVVPWFPQGEGPSPFDRIDADDRALAATSALLGDGWASDYCMVMYSAPKSAGQAWHQDCPPNDPDCYNLNRLVYTRTITDATGGQVVVVPGSHRGGELPVGDPHDALPGERVIAPRQGSLLLVHGHTWHRVMPVGESARTSINYRAVPAGVPAGITDTCVYRNMRYRFSTNEVLETR